jgi:DNA-binding response OmpR family regulator
VVDDDAAIQAVLRKVVERLGHAVRAASSGSDALQAIRSERPALIVLDLGLPDIDGLNILRAVRAKDSNVPVLILTARSSREAALHAFNAGADDYVTKPFDLDVLVARLRALLRRSMLHGRERLLRCGSLVIDPLRRGAHCGGATLPLTAKEFDVLTALVRHQGEVVSIEVLAAAVWHHVPALRTNTYRVTIWSLRRKLQSCGAGLSIVGFRGSGYMIRASEDAVPD